MAVVRGKNNPPTEVLGSHGDEAVGSLKREQKTSWLDLVLLFVFFHGR